MHMTKRKLDEDFGFDGEEMEWLKLSPAQRISETYPGQAAQPVAEVYYHSDWQSTSGGGTAVKGG